MSLNSDKDPKGRSFTKKEWKNQTKAAAATTKHHGQQQNTSHLSLRH